MARRLHTRDVRPGDEEFLYEVFCSTRPDIMEADLPKLQMEAFLRMQFKAQTEHYKAHYPDSDYSVILIDEDVKAGRLFVHRGKDETRILDIAFLPEFRGRGLGSRLLKELMNEVDRGDVPLRIHVELHSRQISFYDRLGFVKINEIPTHQLMEYQPVKSRLSEGAPDSVTSV